MTKLQILKICALSLILGATATAGDWCGTEDAPTRVVNAVVMTEGSTPKAIRIEVPKELLRQIRTKMDSKGKTILDGTPTDSEEESDDALLEAKNLRRTHTMGPDELEKRDLLIDQINTKKDPSLLFDALRAAVDDDHLNTVRWLLPCSTDAAVKTAIGDAIRGRKHEAKKIIFRHKNRKGDRCCSHNVSIFLAKHTPRKVKGLLEAG